MHAVARSCVVGVENWLIGELGGGNSSIRRRRPLQQQNYTSTLIRLCFSFLVRGFQLRLGNTENLACLCCLHCSFVFSRFAPQKLVGCRRVSELTTMNFCFFLEKEICVMQNYNSKPLPPYFLLVAIILSECSIYGRHILFCDRQNSTKTAAEFTIPSNTTIVELLSRNCT